MRTIKEINQKIKEGKAVVVTAEEVAALVSERGLKDAAASVDVVTTATFGPMCSSGIYFNIGHSQPKIKFGGGRVFLDGVPCYGGFAAVDLFLGATALPDDDPRNSVYPGEFKHGGAHVIHSLVSGKDLVLEAASYGTDCYPRRTLKTHVNIRDLNEAVLFNPRNCYQNYNVAVNSSDEVLYTYMGVLRPNLGNATYSSAGCLSPLLNDPLYKTIGVGTRVFLGGAEGYISWHGTQHNPSVPRTCGGIPKSPAGTLALIGDLKAMSPRWLVPTSLAGYGVTLTVGIGIPIPVLNEEVLQYTAVKDEDIPAPIVDYAPGGKGMLGVTDYARLRSGYIELKGKTVPTGSFSSLRRAREIADILKDSILRGDFTLTEAVAPLPGAESGYHFKPLKERRVKNGKG